MTLLLSLLSCLPSSRSLSPQKEIIFHNHDGRSSPWPNHPLRFATRKSSCTHITAIPSTTLCRSYKVSEYQFSTTLCISYKVSEYQLTYYQSHLSLTTACCRIDITTASQQRELHLPHQPLTFPIPRTSLLHQWQRGAAIWGWDIVFIIVCFAWCFWLTCKIFESSDVYRVWYHSSDHPHQPPTPPGYSALKHTSLGWWCSIMRVRNASEHKDLYTNILNSPE